MKYIYTNGKDNHFVLLCSQLDCSLNELAGGEDNRKQYIQHNRLDDIHDVFIVYDGDTPIGCGSFKKYSESVAEVKRVFVNKAYRGLGISKQMMQLLETKAKEKGYQKVILETGRKMPVAIGLYEKLGYCVIGNYGQYEGEANSICFEKVL